MSNLQVSTMNSMSIKGILRAASGLAVFSLVFCGLIYSSVATGLGQWWFPAQANGSLIVSENKIIGSSLVAQPFVSDQYFSPRPSATKYDLMTMAGSNLAQSNPELQQQIQQRLKAIAKREQQPIANIPSDLLTTSGSGIDPDISVEAAMLQIPRIAIQRQIDEKQLKVFVMHMVKPPMAGLYGQSRINVLELNWAMDQTFKAKS